jgi:hypothetical protein
MVVDLAGLLRALVVGEVRFVVIGGIAVAAHAAIRATEDVDIVPDPDPANIERLVRVLEDLDARLLLNAQRGIDDQVKTALAEGKNLTVTTSLGDLDVVQRLPGVPPFAELEQESIGASLFEVPLRVCSKNHLIAMKRARGSALDLADLERLATTA